MTAEELRQALAEWPGECVVLANLGDRWYRIEEVDKVTDPLTGGPVQLLHLDTEPTHTEET